MVIVSWLPSSVMLLTVINLIWFIILWNVRHFSKCRYKLVDCSKFYVAFLWSKISMNNFTLFYIYIPSHGISYRVIAIFRKTFNGRLIPLIETAWINNLNVHFKNLGGKKSDPGSNWLDPAIWKYMYSVGVCLRIL